MSTDDLEQTCADVAAVLERRVERGNTYAKASLVASRLPDVSSKLASVALQRLEERGVVSRWTDNATGITWEINADALDGGEAGE